MIKNDLGIYEMLKDPEEKMTELTDKIHSLFRGYVNSSIAHKEQMLDEQNRSNSYAKMINELDKLTQDQASELQKRERLLKQSQLFVEQFLDMQENWFCGSFTYGVKKKFVEEAKELLNELGLCVGRTDE